MSRCKRVEGHGPSTHEVTVLEDVGWCSVGWSMGPDTALELE